MLTITDPWLMPHKDYLQHRYEGVQQCRKRITDNGSMSLSDFANGYHFFGLHRTDNGWTFREWAPHATQLFLVGDATGWQANLRYQAQRLDSNGVWELNLPPEALQQGQHYKMLVRWQGGEGLRIPAWCQRVVQDTTISQFSAQVWEDTEAYTWQHPTPSPDSPLLIYEAHIGMAQEEERVGTFVEFRDQILPRIAKAGYNAIQLMAIQEHPYYGSFGYHVSSLFAPSSRFGTPEELKSLIDIAHSMNIRVIMDIVHSHAVKNIDEGLAQLAGDATQYFHAPPRGNHPAWDSLCYNYGKSEVMHFLLSNCKYWIEQFHFDGFRFDGVTSMLYHSHGLGENFTNYDDYFSSNADNDAWNYLALANELIHQISPSCITIAEEVSGMPMLTSPVDEGGAGFNYRMAMNIPDYWIKLVKEVSDEHWNMSEMYHQLTNHRIEEHTISYVESHDQALVGDKTLIHRLADADLYWHFSKDNRTLEVDRALALHKMIRLVTFSTINGGYLNFMGNEFGHPEWIDFPREGNGWSYHFARRQWSLENDDRLCYAFLGSFDHDMIALSHNGQAPFSDVPQLVCHHDGDQVLAYTRGELLFVFNFSPEHSYTDYGISVPEGEYRIILDTDDTSYGGQGRNDVALSHSTQSVVVQHEQPVKLPSAVQDTTAAKASATTEKKKTPAPAQQRKEEVIYLLRLYLPARTAMVLQRVERK